MTEQNRTEQNVYWRPTKHVH